MYGIYIILKIQKPNKYFIIIDNFDSVSEDLFHLLSELSVENNTNFKILSLPASIDMVLWRNQPETITTNSDIKVRLLFE